MVSALRMAALCGTVFACTWMGGVAGPWAYAAISEAAARPARGSYGGPACDEAVYAARCLGDRSPARGYEKPQLWPELA